MVTTAEALAELDQTTKAYDYEGQFIVEVSDPLGWDSPQWQVTLHGHGGSMVVESTEVQTIAFERAERLAHIVGAVPHEFWRFGSWAWKAANERQAVYKRSLTLALHAGTDYLVAKADACEAAHMPCASNARWAANRYGRNAPR